MTTQATETLYDRLGGEVAIDAAVDLFYRRVLVDKRINHFFKGIEIQKLRDHQKKFLTVAFGGENRYSGRGMAAAHSRLVNEMGLHDRHFDAVLEHLAGTLEELEVPPELIAEAAAIAESVREQVLGRAED